MPNAAPITRPHEPRWPALLALVGAGGLFFALPPGLKFGPDWIVLVLPGLLALPGVVLREHRHKTLIHVLGHCAVASVTIGMIGSLVLLIARLPEHRDAPGVLLHSAGALWIANVLVFASWYWRLDAGGPRQRDLRESHTDGAFLFPQMTLTPAIRKEMGEAQWSPHFVDYLFLAFTTSTAFSPTDVPVLSRWAKGLVMMQAIISMTSIVIVGARAINIL